MTQILQNKLDTLLQALFEKEIPLVDDADIELAFKVVESKTIRGLTTDERSKIFSSLTNGGVWEGQGRQRSEETVRDLALAIMLEHIQKPREQNQLIRTFTGKFGKYSQKSNLPSSNASKQKKHCADLLKQFEGYDRDLLIDTLMQAMDEEVKLTVDQIKSQIDIIKGLRSALKNI